MHRANYGVLDQFKEHNPRSDCVSERVLAVARFNRILEHVRVGFECLELSPTYFPFLCRVPGILAYPVPPSSHVTTGGCGGARLDFFSVLTVGRTCEHDVMLSAPGLFDPLRLGREVAP